MRLRTGFSLLLFALSACDVPERDAAVVTSADTVAAALATYDPAAFDTIRWESDSIALARGSDVFKWACAECHGQGGAGDGSFVNEQGDTLRPPSFLRPTWRFAGDHDGLRRQVFAGNAQGMPHWGLVKMLPRDIDAVTLYILKELREQP